MKENSIETDKIEKMINKLPEKARASFFWAIENFDFIKKACRNSAMSEEEIEKNIIEALEKDDYIMFILCYTAKIYMNKDKGNEK